jgi:hypothetical protein
MERLCFKFDQKLRRSGGQLTPWPPRFRRPCLSLPWGAELWKIERAELQAAAAAGKIFLVNPNDYEWPWLAGFAGVYGSGSGRPVEKQFGFWSFSENLKSKKNSIIMTIHHISHIGYHIFIFFHISKITKLTHEFFTRSS